ncbi:MAG: hypothetical protein H7255_15845 [Ramlibacter sp.]|nr:hypothetical protein [Ramlibacter sp.]
MTGAVASGGLRIHLPPGPAEPEVEAPPATAAGTDGSVAPGASASKAPAGPSMFNSVLLFAGLAAVAGIAGRAAWRGNQPVLGDFPDIAARLVNACAIETLGIGDHHNRIDSFDIHTGAMAAALAATAARNEPVVHFVEQVSLPGQYQAKHDDERALATRDGRRRWAYLKFTHTPFDKPEDREVIREFMLAFEHPRMSTKIVNWADPSTDEIARIAATPGLKLVSVGSMHWISKMHGGLPNIATTPFLGASSYDAVSGTSHNLMLLPEGYHPPVLNSTAQRKIVNALKKLEAQGPVMYMMASEFWTSFTEEAPLDRRSGPFEPSETRKRYIEHYTNQNYAVLEIPVRGGSNVSALVPMTCLDELKKIAAEYPAVRLFHKETASKGV